MTLKKLIALIITAFSLSTISYAAESALLQEETITAEQIAQEIAICQEIQKQCSKQVGYVTAILQQIVAGIQKGSIKTSVAKTELLKKIYAYISLTHELQSMSVMTADTDNLFTVTIILKNLIDRLTIAVNSDLVLLAEPTLENLLVPEKNFAPSFEYLFGTLEKNNQKLDQLAHSSTSLGLTFVNKTVRACENFYKNYKWFIWTPVGIAALYYLKNALRADYSYDLKTPVLKIDSVTGVVVGKDVIKDTINTTYGAYIKDAFFSNATAPNLIASSGGLALLLGEKKIQQLGSYLIDGSITWVGKKYQLLSQKTGEAYSNIKGIKNIQREGLATSLENVPTLNDNQFIGLEDQTSELLKLINYLSDPELYIRSDNEICKCILLIGPSRTGKTALAKSFGATINQLYNDAGSPLKVEFIEADHTLINSQQISLQGYIAAAIAKAPSVLFIDEIHLLGLQKNGNRELLNEFLTQLAELHKIKDPTKQVFIIAATNHPELLAPELFKHERFGKVIRFKKPGIAERAHFFASSFKKFGINAENINLKGLVLQTRDCDYGHLQQIIKDARFAARITNSGVGQTHLQQAVNTIVHGINSTAELSKEEARISAIDQAGKIVAHYKLNINEIIHLATIGKVDGKIEEDNFWMADKKDTEVMPIRYGAIVSTSNREEIPCSDAIELEKLCKRYLSGIAAQKVILGTYYIDYSAQDYKAAFELAQKIVLKGLPVKTLPEEQRNRIFQETQRLVDLYELEVIELLKSQVPLIEKLVAELIKERCMTGNDINTIVQ